jgi:hypothetical protein
MTGTPTAAERLASAKLIVANLRAKLRQTAEKVASLTKQRAELSLQAHLGNGEAQAMVAEINEAMAAPRLEIETLAEALAAAEQKVTEAADPKHIKQERQVAEWCLKVDAEASAHAAKADKALAQFVEHFNSYRQNMIELHEAGYAPSLAVLDVNARIALASQLMATSLKFDHVPPSARLTFIGMAEHYSKGVQGHAAKRLVKEKELAA